MVAVVACGSRTVIDAVFGPFTIGEIRYAPRLFGRLRPDMLLLADRNFAVKDLVEQIHAFFDTCSVTSTEDTYRL